MLDLLVALKLLCKCLWPNQADEMNSLRLQVILRMLKTPHFSTRMNALKVFFNLRGRELVHFNFLRTVLGGIETRRGS